MTKTTDTITLRVRCGHHTTVHRASSVFDFPEEATCDLDCGGATGLLKGLRVDIYTGASTNRVPFETLTLVGAGIDEVSTATPEAPAVRIVEGNLRDTLKAVLEDGIDSPAAFVSGAGRDGGSRTWSMASGAFIYSCDSRFRRVSDGPVALHNRYEV